MLSGPSGGDGALIRGDFVAYVGGICLWDHYNEGVPAERISLTGALEGRRGEQSDAARAAGLPQQVADPGGVDGGQAGGSDARVAGEDAAAVLIDVEADG